MKRKSTLVFVFCLCLACLASGDTLKLTNGQVIYGVFMGRSAEGISFLGPDGTTKTYSFSQVGSLPFGPIPSASQQTVIQDYAHGFLTMNDQKADQLAHRVMEIDEQQLVLRKKYYDILKKALPVVLVVRFFQLENQNQFVVDLQIASNLPIIEEAPPK